MERTVQGTIEKWSELKAGFKKDGMTPWAKRSCKIADEWYSFFSQTGASLNEMVEEYPEGTTVQFVQWKGKEEDQYWNYKEKSLTKHQTSPESIGMHQEHREAPSEPSPENKPVSASNMPKLTMAQFFERYKKKYEFKDMTLYHAIGTFMCANLKIGVPLTLTKKAYDTFKSQYDSNIDEDLGQLD